MSHLRTTALALVLVATPALAQDDAERDRGLLTRFIEDNLSTVSRQVTVLGFEGALSSEATVEELTIADSEGVWLRATGLVLDWNRSALLRGRVEVEELSAETLIISRPPIPDPQAPQAEATPFSLPELPVSIDVGDFSIAAITLGEPFLGEEVRLELAGSANLADGEGAATLEANRIDGGEGRFLIEGSYSNDSEVLDLTLDLSEGPDGLLANAIGLPGQPAVDLTLQGTGPIRDYAADITLATDGEERVAGTFELARTGTEEAPETDLTLDLSGDLRPLIPETYHPFVGAQADLTLTAAQDADGSIRVPQLRLAADALALDGQVELGPDRWPRLIDLRGEVIAEDGTAIAVPGGAGATRLGRADISVQYDQAQGSEWSAVISVDDFAQPTLTIGRLALEGGGTIEPPADGQPGAFTGDLTYEAAGLDPANEDLARALGPRIAGRLSLSRDAGPVEIRAFTLTGPGIDLDGSGTVAGADESFLTDLTFDLTSDDLSRFAGLAGVDLTGAATLDIALSTRPLDGAFDVTLDGQTDGLGIGDDRVDPLLAGIGTLHVEADRDETGTRLSDLSIDTDALTLDATADLTSGASSADFSFVIPDVSLVVPDLAGRAELTGTARLAEDGSGTVTVAGDVPQGRIGIDATLADEASGGGIDLAALIDLTDIAPYSTLAERDIDGALRLAVDGTAARDFGTFDLAVNLASQDLAVGMENVDPILDGALTATADVRRFGPTSFRVTDLNASSPLVEASGSIVYDQTRVEADGLSLRIRDLAPFGALAGRDLAGSALVDATGSLQTDLSLFDMTVTLESRDLSVGDPRFDPMIVEPLTLAARVQRSGPLAFSVSGLDLQSPLWTATGEVRVADGRVETDGLSLRAADLSTAALLAGRDLDGALAADLSGTAALDGSTFDLTLDAFATDLALGDARIDPLLAGTVTLSGAATRPGPMAFTVTDLYLASPNLDARGSATLADGIVTTEGLSLEAADLSVLAPLAGRALDGALRADVSGQAALDAATFDLTVDATATDLAVGDARIDPLLVGTVTLSGAATRTGPMDFTVTGLDLASPIVVAQGDLTLADGVAQTDGLDLRVADLAPFSALAGRDLGGRIEASATGEAALDGSVLDLSVDATAQDLAIGDPRIDALLAGQVTFRAEADRTGPNAFSITELDLVSPLITARGAVDVADGVARTDGLTLDVADLDQVAGLAGRDLDGTLTAEVSGQAALDFSTFDLALDAEANDLSIGDPRIDPLLAGRVTLTGEAERTGPMAFAVTGLDLVSPLVAARGDLALEDGRVTLNGVSFDLADLSAFAGLAGRPLDGAVQGTADGSAALDGSTFDLDVSLRTQDVEVGIDAVDNVLAGAGRLDGRVIRTGPLSFEAQEVSASTPVLGLTLDGDFTEGAGEATFDLALDDASVLAPGLDGGLRIGGDIGRAGDGTLALDVTGRGPGGLDLVIDATLDPVEEAQGLVFDAQGMADVTVERLAPYAALAGQQVSGGLRAELTGSLRSDLSRFDLVVDGATSNLSTGIAQVDQLLAGDGTINGRIIREKGGAILAEGLQVAFPNIRATADADTRPDGTIAASFDVTLADLGLFVPDFPGPATARGTASRGPSGAWTVNADVTGPGSVAATVNGTYGPGATDIRVQGSAPLGLANDFIEPRRLEGPASFDLRYTGGPGLTGLTGTVSTSGARLSLPTLGEALTDISGSVRLDGDRAVVDLGAAVQDGGRLAISGPVGLGAGYPADLTVTATGLTLRDPLLYETTADGRITIRGPLTGGANIAGEIVLGETNVRVPAGSLGNVGSLAEVAHVGAPGDVRTTLARAGLTVAGVPIGRDGGGASARGPVYGLDIVIRAPGRIFIRGRGLDAELGGELRIGGTTAQIIPAGQFDLIRGRLDILQQRFELDEGSAALAGDFNPYLRLVATTEAEDGTQVRIVLEGPADDLELTLSSSPDLPEDEILARLLFGRDFTSISPLQAVQLAAAAAQLAGGGPGVTDRFREGVGLDDLDITTDDSGGLAVRAGQYLTENIYTDVTVGPAGTEVNINLDLSDSLTVRGSVDSEGDTSLGIFFERDY